MSILLSSPGPAGPNLGPLTAEDVPPSPESRYGAATGRIFCSIAMRGAGSNERGQSNGHIRGDRCLASASPELCL